MSELTKIVRGSGELEFLRRVSEEDIADLCRWAANRLECLCTEIEKLEITLEEVRGAARMWEKAAQASSAALGDAVIRRMRRDPEQSLPTKAKPQFIAGPDECDTGVALTKAIEAVLKEDEDK